MVRRPEPRRYLDRAASGVEHVGQARRQSHDEPGSPGFVRQGRDRAPVGVDQAEPGNTMPVTMRRYQLQGTPSLLAIDRSGALRTNAFGQVDDLGLGALLARLIDEPERTPERP